MDILGALEAAPKRGSRRCSVGVFLDSIPEDTPGRDELVRLVETIHGKPGISDKNADTRAAASMAFVLTQLGFETTQNPIHNHRNHTCRCYR